MKTLIACVAAAVLALCPGLATGQSTAFSYQGRVVQNGVPASGTFDLKLGLYDAESGGNAIGDLVCFDNVQVTDGTFTAVVPLALPASGADSFLEIRVRPGGLGSCAIPGGFTTLTPRQRITPAPIAALAYAVTTSPPPIKGAIRLNTTTGRFEGYNGAFWYAFAVSDPVTPSNVQEYATPGNFQFVVPAGVSSIGVDAWSGGGGGGGGANVAAATSCASPPGGSAGAGGGGGGYVRVIIDVAPGDTLEINVGAGGAGGAQGANGGNGTLSSVLRNGTAVVRVLGGHGGGLGPDLVGTIAAPLPCNSIAAPTFAIGGSGGTVLTATGIVLAQHDGNAGDDVLGPRCNTNNGSFCGTTFGSGGVAFASPVPLGGTVAGAGGRGAQPLNAGGPGSEGKVRLFWN